MQGLALSRDHPSSKEAAARSELDEEINLVALDPAFVRLLDEQFEQDIERSEEIVAGRWEDRSLGRRALEGLMKPLRHKI